jgi:hypoxanthine phosphoribosyltransferase
MKIKLDNYQAKLLTKMLKTKKDISIRTREKPTPHHLILWDELAYMIERILQQVDKDNLVFDGVYGIPRGGLPLAVVLSHHLNIPLLVHPTKNTLVCDDISDTGKTLSTIKHKKIACLYSSKWTKTKPDYYSEIKTNKKEWLVFPWENIAQELNND